MCKFEALERRLNQHIMHKYNLGIDIRQQELLSPRLTLHHQNQMPHCQEGIVVVIRLREMVTMPRPKGSAAECMTITYMLQIGNDDNKGMLKPKKSSLD